jgi:hypothetical protein
MGGFGSGRHGKTLTSEATACYVLTLRAFKTELRSGQRLSRNIWFGRGNSPIRITIDISDPADAFIELVHHTRDSDAGTHIVRDRVRLTWTEPTYGGRRWWFVCPQTGRRTPKLFLPNGGRHFWSRQAYDLGYACQREGRFSRLQRRAAMLNEQLGGLGWETWYIPPKKPKWMRWRTYQRKYNQWERVALEANAEFKRHYEKTLRREEPRESAPNTSELISLLNQSLSQNLR